VTTQTPFLLGIVGDSGSGKSTLADAVALLLGPEHVADVRLDDYHRFTREERAAKGLTALSPTVHNLPLMREHLQLLRQGRPIRNRSYDHADGTFGPIRTIEAREVVLVRGLLGFPDEETRSLYDLTVFLQPEAELLYRWKLRRDVLSRGYTEAEVLKYIANHLLDAKQFVLPQSERADVVVRYRLPDPDAPDREILTSLLLRRDAAELARTPGFLGALASHVRLEPEEDALLVEVEPHVAGEAVAAWGRESFPERYDPQRVGAYTEEGGAPGHRADLALVEIFVARATTALRARR
jgi:uridine kinase